MQLPDVILPAAFRFTSIERDAAGETNDVYRCTGEFDGRPLAAYVKVAKRANSSLANERAILERLAATAIPVPRVLWYGDAPREVLVLEALPGEMVWEYIDPRRELFRAETLPAYLHAYGACLGQIHALALGWSSQKRPRLYELIGEEAVTDPRFQRLVSWVRSHATRPGLSTFVHGDLNTASVLFRDGRVSGVVDWEFAGTGWREYDLAWVLRARTAFLNTRPEREAILSGYRLHSSYEPAVLRYCEVLNYLHFAYWCREAEPDYTSFALGRAAELAGL